LAKKNPIFTVDWESWWDAIPQYVYDKKDDRIYEPTIFLLKVLDIFSVKAIFYILGSTMIRNLRVYDTIIKAGHIIGTHGHFHRHNLYIDHPLFRSPYWDTTPMPYPPSGGFFFRLLPFNYIKWAIEKSGVFWIHPHDLDTKHPYVDNKWINLKRHIGLKKSRLKLFRLLSEVEFGEPSKN